MARGDFRAHPFWFLRRRPDEIGADVEEEIETHLAMRVDELKRQGWTDADARREAARQFGDRQRATRYCMREDLLKTHQVQRALSVRDLLHDTTICLRGLSRAPTLTATILLTVGLGIGATTAMFAAVHAVWLRPLPYRDPGRLVRIYTDSPPHHFNFSVADYLTLDREQTTFDRIAGYVDRAMIFSDGSGSELIRGRVVSWRYFDLLGLRPAIGREFTADDAHPEHPPAVIVSHSFWTDRLAGRMGAIGGPVRLDGADYTLVGVLPDTLGPLERGREFYLAARWTQPLRKGPFFIRAIGRLRREADRSAASTELALISTRMFPVWRASYQDDRATWRLTDLKDDLVGDTKTVAGVAVAAVSVMWLIACANASSLLLARVTSRRRELAVRTALGASRARLVRLLLAEGGVLAIGAALIGVAVAAAGIALLQHIGSAYVARTEEIALDRATWLMLAGLGGASALLFGLIPAWHGARRPIASSLRLSSRSATENVQARRGRRILVATQFAIATPLLMAAALLLISLEKLEHVELGFDTRNILTVGIRLPGAQYQNEARANAWWGEVGRRTAALPGVSAVTFADGRPPDDVGNFNNFDLETFPTAPGQSQPVTPWVAVTHEYFRTLGLSLLEGRLLDERDAQPSSPTVVVVDRAWARRFFPSGSALDRRLRSGGCTTCPWTTVVGVVSVVKYAGLDKPDEGSVYTALSGENFRYLVVRTHIAPTTVLPALRQMIRDLDPSVGVSDVATIDELIERSVEMPRSLSWLIAAFAAAALLLSSVGIYGVMSHHVQQHARDMCIRLALGGAPRLIVRQVVRQGMAVVVVGVGAGLALAFVSMRLMSNLLFGIGALDLPTFAAVSAVLISVAWVACVMPGRRAVRFDPATVLRND